MPRTTRLLGDSLVALTEQLPTVDIDEIWNADREHPAEVAADTPFLRRMRALLATIAVDGPIDVTRARGILRDGAPVGHLEAVTAGSAEFVLLRAALRRDLLRCTEVDEGHPLGLWGQLALRASVEGQPPDGFVEAHHHATMPAHTWN